MVAYLRDAPRVLIGALCVAANVSAAEPAAQTKEEIAGYSGVGRIKWRIPTGPDFACGFKVPHFTQGARVGCGFRATGAQTEIEVYSRDLTIDPLLRRDRFEAEVTKMLPESKDPTFTIKTHGPSPAIVYATLTHKDPGKKNPRLTVGYFSKGPFYIRFIHESSDASERELERVFGVVLSAEPLDAVMVLAWKLSDYKEVCASWFPKQREANDAAYAASMFAAVDWLRLMQEQASPAPPEKVTEDLRRARGSLADDLARGPFDELERFCGSFPAMTIEAERGLPGGRRRGTVGINGRGIVPEAARASGLPPTSGALVEGVSTDGPAARAGLRRGDVILRLAGEDISSFADVIRIVGSRPSGSKIDATIARGGEGLTVSITTADAPD